MPTLLDVPLTRRLRRLPVIPLLHGRLATAAWSWDRRDQFTREWWPQGITWAGSVTLVSWYAKSGGSRVSLVSVASRRYSHVTLLGPAGEPMKIHAGGIAWIDGWLYAGATSRGFWTWHESDLDPAAGTWPASECHRPEAPSGGPLRWSFLDMAGSALIGGEYGRGTKSTRVFRLKVADGVPIGPVELLGDGPKGMQGLTKADSSGSTLVASVSHGPWVRGSLHPVVDPVVEADAGTPVVEGPANPVVDANAGPSVVEVRAQRATRPAALPIGVEDLTRDADGQVWTVSEHPARRAVVRLTSRR